MTDLDAILATVLDRPADDLPRLVYADALEDRDGPGDAARAEFVRVQVGLAGITYRDQTCRYCRENCGECKTKYCRIGGDPDGKNNHRWENPRRNELKNREVELFMANYAAWFPTIREVTINPPNEREQQSGGTFYVVRRGLIHTARAPLAVLRGERCQACFGIGDLLVQLDHGATQEKCLTCHGTGRTGGVLAELVRREPVERVEVVDKQPYQQNTDGCRDQSLWPYCWANNDGGHGGLHESIFCLLKGYFNVPSTSGVVKLYRTEATAIDALSRALLLEAKQNVAVPA